jgi:hypothetical protein
MATLIKLTFPARKPAPRASSTCADIIIFPGVRYERLADTAAEKPKRKRKSRAKSGKQVLVAR